MVGKSNLFELVFPSGVFFLESGGKARNFLEIVGGSGSLSRNLTISYNFQVSHGISPAFFQIFPNMIEALQIASFLSLDLPEVAVRAPTVRR